MANLAIMKPTTKGSSKYNGLVQQIVRANNEAVTQQVQRMPRSTVQLAGIKFIMLVFVTK